MIFSKRLVRPAASPRMSRHCTSGRPASIIVANWRVKMTRSRIFDALLQEREDLGEVLGLRLHLGRRDAPARAACAIAASTSVRVDHALLRRARLASCLPSRTWAWWSPRSPRLASPCGRRAAAHARSGSRSCSRARRGRELRAHRVLERDQRRWYEVGERLVHRLHAELGLADLHLRVDLVDLVLADQVADRRVRAP